jgi:hypothetical protein
MDCKRHQTDSEAKYTLYFDLLHQKMQQYDVGPENTYNMNGKRIPHWHHPTLQK